MMEYNNYYPAQAGPPPLPPPTMMNNQADCSMMSGSMTPTSIMHSSPAPSTPQSMRHTPGPAPMQQHHSMGHHQQPSPHPNYHQLPPHPPISHSASPHPSSTPHSQGQPPPRPATGPSPLHHQMPPHMNGQSPKIPPPGPMPNSGPMHPAAMASNNHHHHHHHASGPPPPPPPHGHGYPNNPMPPQYGQPPMNHQAPGVPPPMNHRQQPIPNGSMMGGAPPPHPSGYMPPHPGPQERGSPFYPHMPQTEFRIIELNKRLQGRPRVRTPPSPLPDHAAYEESQWWERFACEFFHNEATLTVRIPGENRPIEYTIGRALIPRFFKSYFDGGVTDLSIRLRNVRETQHHPNLTTMECDQADIITKNIFRHPANMYMYVVVHTEGHLSLEFVNNSFDNLVIKSWRFYVTQCNEYIDRSVTSPSLPYANLTEPVTLYGLTKSTRAFLKMCLVMEPMQDLMSLHKQTNFEPRSCLKTLLYDKYNFKNPDDKSAPKRRKRKPAEPGATTTKKSKAGANMINNAMNNNLGLMNESDPGMPNLPLASQDVLVVGEPSMLGADFGDENERRITRLENNQYESPSEQGGQQSGILDDGSNQIDQICMPSATMKQEQQSDITSHLTHGNGHDSSGNNVQSMLGYPANGEHTDEGSNSQGGGISKHDANESNITLTNNNNNINNNGNCLQGNNDLTNADDTNHHMNSYAMNGETIHIKSEMELQTKQSMQPNPIAESEAR